MEPNNKEPEPVATKKTFIADFSRMLNMFQPTLVNDKNEVWVGDPGQVSGEFKWNGTFHAADGVNPMELPLMGRLLNMAFAAMRDIKGFMGYHEKLKGALLSTQQAFAEIETTVLEEKASEEQLQPLATISEVKRLKQENKKMRDVLEHAASHSPEKALAAAQAWVFKNGVPPNSPHSSN